MGIIPPGAGVAVGVLSVIVALLVAFASPAVIYKTIIEFGQELSSHREVVLHELDEIKGRMDEHEESTARNEKRLEELKSEVERHGEIIEQNTGKLHDMILRKHREENGGVHVAEGSPLNCEDNDCPICENRSVEFGESGKL